MTKQTIINRKKERYREIKWRRKNECTYAYMHMIVFIGDWNSLTNNYQFINWLFLKKSITKTKFRNVCILISIGIDVAKGSVDSHSIFVPTNHLLTKQNNIIIEDCFQLFTTILHFITETSKMASLISRGIAQLKSKEMRDYLMRYELRYMIIIKINLSSYMF